MQEGLNILKKIKENILFKNDKLYIEKTLNRKEYLEINKIIENFSGKWTKRDKCFIFSEIDKVEEFKTIIFSENKKIIKYDKNELEFFPTPKKLVLKMLEKIIDKNKKMNILEPSAGTGNIVEELIKECVNSNIEVCEIDEKNIKILKEKNIKIVEYDFLKLNKKYDLIVMNPPFNIKGQNKTYINHILHAFDRLKEKGQLLAIAPTSFIENKNKKEKNFLDFVNKNGYYIVNENNSFKESKTSVSTVLIDLKRS